MSRRRYISTKISVDTRVNRLAMDCGDFAALLYTWMIPHAEDDATLPADPEQLLLMVAPGRRDKAPEDIEAAVAGMVRLGLIERHGPAHLRFPPAAFYAHQSYITEARREKRTSAQRHAPLNEAPQISADQRTSAQNAASFKSSSSSSSSDSIPEVVLVSNVSDAAASDERGRAAEPAAVAAEPEPVKTRPAPKPERDPKGPAAFQAFYDAYPKHEARQDALAAWLKLKPDGDLCAAIMAGVGAWQASGRWTDPKYIPLPATFLNGRRWEDEPAPAVPAAPPRASPNGNGHRPGPLSTLDKIRLKLGENGNDGGAGPVEAVYSVAPSRQRPDRVDPGLLARPG